MEGKGQACRLALVGINSQYVHSALAPWCLRAGLFAYARTPFTAQVVEGTVNEPVEALLARIVDIKPQLVCISCYIWNIKTVAALLPLLKSALPGGLILLGGPEVSYRAADVLHSYPEADYVLCGEGEQPLALFVDALQGQGSLTQVPGLCFRTAQGLHLSPPHQHEAMQPSPYCPEYFKALQGRIAYLETSRGCPYACAFCLSGRGEKLRQAPLPRVYEEILQLAQSGSRTIKLVDRTFNADKARACSILAFIIGEWGRGIPRGITFHFEIAGDLLDEATLNLVAQAPPGLFQFEIGLQSMDEGTLRLVRRRTDMAHLQTQVRQLISLNKAHVHLDLIAGLPGEDLAAFMRGFDAAYHLKPQALQLGFLKVIHGSAMREEGEAYPMRFDPEPPYQVQQTPWMRPRDFEVLQLAERGLDKLHNAGRFARTLAYLTGPAGLSPFFLFHQLGQAICAAEQQVHRSLSLDQLSNLVQQQLALLLPEQTARLRDLLVQDRLSSTKTSRLPDGLKRPDARYHRVKRALDSKVPRPKNSLRALAFLYAGPADQVVYCDYTETDPVSGSYPLHILSVSEILND